MNKYPYNRLIEQQYQSLANMRSELLNIGYVHEDNAGILEKLKEAIEIVTKQTEEMGNK